MASLVNSTNISRERNSSSSQTLPNYKRAGNTSKLTLQCIAGRFFTTEPPGMPALNGEPKSLQGSLLNSPRRESQYLPLQKRTAFYWVTFHQSAPQSLNILCLVAFLMSSRSDSSLHEKGEFKVPLFYC